MMGKQDRVIEYMVLQYKPKRESNKKGAGEQEKKEGKRKDIDGPYHR